MSLLGVKAITRKSLDPYFREFSLYIFKSGSLSSNNVSDDASNWNLGNPIILIIDRANKRKMKNLKMGPLGQGAKNEKKKLQ